MVKLTKYTPASIMPREFNRPWALLRNFQNEFDRMFNNLYPKTLLDVFETEGNFPAVDIQDKDDSYRVEANVPGVDPKDIEIQLDKDRLTLKGKVAQEYKKEDQNYLCAERSYGEFSRTFYLPDIDQQAEANADYKNGVLCITLPKAKSSKARRIEVKAQ